MKSQKNFLLVICLGFALSSYASLSSNIDKLIQTTDPNLNIGVHVVEAKSGDVLYNRHAERYYFPASVFKIVTDTMALDILGPNFTFKTKLWKGSQPGQYALQFNGDPTFTYENLVALFKHLKGKNVSALIVDTTNPYPLKTSPGAWTQEMRRYCYATPLNPLMINRNGISFKIDASKPEAGASIILAPGNYVQVKGKPKIAEKCELNSTFEREHMTLSYPLITIQSACQQTSKDPLDMCLPVPPEQNQKYIKEMIVQAFSEAMGSRKHSIKVKFEDVNFSKRWNAFAEHNSQPLFMFLKKAMTESDNLVMDRLMMEVLMRIAPDIRDWQEISKVIAQWAETRFQLDLSKIVIGDGAGASRYNQITPHQITALLQKIYQDPVLYPLVYQSLAVPGDVNGTLETRLLELKERLAAKTGAHRSTTGLSGYLTSKDGDLIIFAILSNSFYDEGTIAHKKPYKKLEDQIVQRLAEI